MADTAGEAFKPTEFQIGVNLNIEAKDVVNDIGPLDTLQFIEELDEQIDSWEATILLARHFAEMAKHAPADLLVMSVEDLEKRLEETNDE